MLLNLIGNPQQFVAFVTALLVAITVHEFAHAWAADKLGDPTARRLGRLTFNPLAHLDPIGTIFLFLAGFGWGKPVPVNTGNLKNEKIDNILISLAGPLSNFITAAILGLIMRFIAPESIIFSFLGIMAIINLTLMVFNLLPIPPLDGSSVIKAFLPHELSHTFDQLGIFILFAFLIFSNYFPILGNIISWIINVFFALIVNQQITNNL